MGIRKSGKEGGGCFFFKKKRKNNKRTEKAHTKQVHTSAKYLHSVPTTFHHLILRKGRKKRKKKKRNHSSQTSTAIFPPPPLSLPIPTSHPYGKRPQLRIETKTTHSH